MKHSLNMYLCTISPLLSVGQYRSDTKFSYRNSNASKSLLMEVENSRAFVTTVHYIPQLLTLFVGYNFGGFQLYHMRTLDIV